MRADFARALNRQFTIDIAQQLLFFGVESE
jgi:hypothetical protein